MPQAGHEIDSLTISENPDDVRIQRDFLVTDRYDLRYGRRHLIRVDRSLSAFLARRPRPIRRL